MLSNICIKNGHVGSGVGVHGGKREKGRSEPESPLANFLLELLVRKNYFGRERNVQTTSVELLREFDTGNTTPTCWHKTRRQTSKGTVHSAQCKVHSRRKPSINIGCTKFLWTNMAYIVCFRNNTATDKGPRWGKRLPA